MAKSEVDTVKTFDDLEFKEIIKEMRVVIGGESSCSFRLNREVCLKARKIDCDKYNLIIYGVENDIYLREREVISGLTEDGVNIEMVKRTIAWLRVK